MPLKKVVKSDISPGQLGKNRRSVMLFLECGHFQDRRIGFDQNIPKRVKCKECE